MSILVTRPTFDAKLTANMIKSEGFEVFVEPMLDIRFVRESADELRNVLEEDVQALIITSANAARALEHFFNRRNIPVIAVGGATADILKAAEFTDVCVAGGDVVQLEEFVKETRDPADGKLIYCSGDVVSSDLAGDLSKEGFDVQQVVLYKALPILQFTDQLQQKIAEGGIEAVTFCSSRTAEVFVTLVQHYNLQTHCEKIDLFVLSDNIKKVASDIDWRSVQVASQPQLPKLVETIKACYEAEAA